MSAKIITGSRPEIEHKTFSHAVSNEYIATDAAEREMMAWVRRNNNIPADAMLVRKEAHRGDAEIWSWEWWEITL